MHTARKHTVAAHAARAMVDAAVARAEELGARVCVAVVDDGGSLKALDRMDGASFMTTGIAMNKAITAAGTGVATGTLAAAIADDPALLAGLSNQEHVAIVPGGVPIIHDGAIAGAIGVSGGTVDEDQPIADAGVAALEGLAHA